MYSLPPTHISACSSLPGPPTPHDFIFTFQPVPPSPALPHHMIISTCFSLPTTCTHISAYFSLPTPHVLTFQPVSPSPHHMYSHFNLFLPPHTTCTHISACFSLPTPHVLTFQPVSPSPHYMYSHFSLFLPPHTTCTHISACFSLPLTALSPPTLPSLPAHWQTLQHKWPAPHDTCPNRLTILCKVQGSPTVIRNNCINANTVKPALVTTCTYSESPEIT